MLKCTSARFLDWVRRSVPDQTIESFLAFTLANALSYEQMQKSVLIIDFYKREPLSFQQRMDKIC